MSTETPEATVVDQNQEENQEDRRLENAGSTPLPNADESPEKEPTGDRQATTVSQPEHSTTTEEVPAQPQLVPAADVSELSSTALQSAPPTTGTDPAIVFNGRSAQDGLGQQQPLPLSLNKLAIFASAQNKLPVSKVKSIVLRLGRHTESSVQKSGKWYKSDNYVDKDSYTWRNMPLFEDHQTHLWTADGTVRSSCKK